MIEHTYEVEGKAMGTCGRFSMITAKNLKYPKNGFNSLIADRGYKKGDIVYEKMNDVGTTLLVKKNGKVIFEHDHQKEAREHEAWLTALKKEKGLI